MEKKFNGERPRRDAGNMSGRSYGDRPARRFSDRREGGYGSDRPRRFEGSEDRPRRSFGDGERSFGDRPRRSYGDRPQKPYGDRPARRFDDRGPRRFDNHGPRHFDDRPRRYGDRGAASFGDRETGIENMLSRKPVIDGAQDTGETFTPEAPDQVRLNKFIANSGICSRREADQMILAGVVTVNGEVVSELGTKVNPSTDDVRFNGERLKGEEKVYIVMNKPKGVTTSTSDPHNEKVVTDLLKGCKARVFPVGRLDKNTTGVLMLTNDGEISERLTHPSYDKKKIYQVLLDRPLEAEDRDRILSGITLTDGDIKADELEYIDSEDHRKLGIEIHSGKNRIVRRIFDSLGYEVTALDRVYFAGLTKKGLQKGEWRYLTDSEVNILRMGAYV